MSTSKRSLRQAGLLAAVLALAVALAVPTQASAQPRKEATEWLASQLKSTSEGSYCPVFGEASVGETIECMFDFKAAGSTFASQRKKTYEWVLANKSKYVGSKSCETTTEALSAGAVAKLALAVEAQKGNPKNIGGRNLIADLECLQVASGAETGRFSDKNQTDFSNTFTQSLAIIALHECELHCAGAPNLKAPVEKGGAYLRKQQCAGGKASVNGAFRSNMALAASECNEEPPFEPENPNSVEVDSTGAAVQGLLAEGGAESKTAAETALSWLKKNQQKAGDWENYCSATESRVLFGSVNSTALAVMADVDGKIAIGEARKWLEKLVEKQAVGKRGLPACGETGEPEVFSTAQGIFGMYETSYPKLAAG